MKPNKINLSSSVSLSAIKTDKFKTGMIAFSLALPLSRELSAYNLLLSGVLRRGTASFPSMADLNKRLDELYASSVEIKTSRLGKNEVFIISAEMLDNAFVTDGTDVLEGVVHLISEVLLHPKLEDGSFPEKTLLHEKSNVCDAIKAEMNNPKLYAADRCAELMRRNDPEFPTLASLLDNVTAADSSTLFEHYKNLIEMTALNIFYIGSEDIVRVSEIIKKYFSSFNGKKPLLNPILPQKLIDKRDVSEPFEVSQGKLCLGFRSNAVCSDDKYFAAVLFNEIFGGSPASKLFINVRERLGLCYYCSSSYDSYSGNITVSSGINVDTVEQTRAEILAQLDNMKKGNISDVELTAAKKSVSHWYRQIYDYPPDLFAFYSTRSMLGIDASPEDYLKKFDEVTREQIIDIAKEVELDTVFFLQGTLDSQDDFEEECDE